MPGIFVDTAGWAGFLLRTEPFHRQAAQLLDRARRDGASVVTTNYLMAKLVGLLTSPLRVQRSEQLRILETLRAATWIRFIHIDQHQDQAAWNLLTRHTDKSWSLVDCSSFVVMKELSVTTALTTDHHFEQAGFVRLLR